MVALYAWPPLVVRVAVEACRALRVAGGGQGIIDAAVGGVRQLRLSCGARMRIAGRLLSRLDFLWPAFCPGAVGGLLVPELSLVCV